MHNPNKKTIFCLSWLIVLMAVLTAAWFVIALNMRRADTPGLPPQDDITMETQADGSRQVTDATEGYQVTVPPTWYVEKNAGSGVTIYPDYDPAQDVAPVCKFEISVLPNPTHADLEDWLNHDLHADPTADMTETARATSTISGYPAITWSGILNEVPVTLTYISRPDLGEGSVYEIAPSLMGDDGSASTATPLAAASGTECLAGSARIISSFQTLP